MQQDSQVTVHDIAGGNVGFFIAQALLEALIRRKVLAPEDVLPMLQEVVDGYRQPGSPERAALNDSMANVLASIIGHAARPR